MADTRINALSTATSSTSDDFVPIDGTTNGTRKLSAYSPSFGGNATVGGTLTVTGVVTASNAVNAAGIIGTTAVAQRITNTSGAFQIYKDATPSIAARFSLNTAAADTAAVGVYNGSSWTDPLQVNTTQVLVTTTTASTSTSSGALVVGNGTSGGLGVGGALYVGSAGTFGGTVRVSTGNGTAATFSLLQAGQQQWAVEIPASTTNLRLRAVDAAVDALTLGTNGSGTFAGAVTISSTTASTSTSSGALVVSGGVGVAGAIYAGGVTNATGGVRIENSGGTLVRFVLRNNYGATDEKAWVWDVDNEGSLFLRALTDAETGSTTILSLPRLGAGAGVTSVSFNANVNHTFAGAVVANRASNAFRITTAQTPASASATGTAGTIAWDTSYIYVCTATNTWKRVAISTW